MTEKLAGLHPDLVAKITRVLAVMDAMGHPMMITDGLRTVAEQQALYAQGRTAPGSIVTNCDGERKRSNHQDGRAVDCAFLVKGKPSWANTLPWSQYGLAAESEGLAWGGRWKKPDRPHVELHVVATGEQPRKV